MIQQPRPVKFRTIYEVLKKRPVLLKFTLLFTIPSVIVSIFMFTIIPGMDDDAPDVDYEQVKENGDITTGIVTRIGTQYNVTINGQHPSIVYYTYPVGGDSVKSKFKTLSLENLQVGDKVEVKYLANDSIITSLEPFDFPFEVFLLIPCVFILIVLSCGWYLYYLTRKELDLYKYGYVTQAEVLGMSHVMSVNLFVRRAMGRVKVEYRYQNLQNRTFLGESVSTDVTLLNTLKRHDPIKIFVSHEDESKSTLVPLMESIRNNWNI